MDDMGYLVNPIITVVPGSPPMQEVLDGGGLPMASLILGNPPTLIGNFTASVRAELVSAGFILESPRP